MMRDLPSVDASAERLFPGRKAVIQELFRKAGVRTRSQLVRIAIEKHASDWLESQL